MLKSVDFKFNEIREKAEEHYNIILKYEGESYLFHFTNCFSMIFDGIGIMCGQDEQLKGPVGNKINYTFFSSLFFEDLKIDDFFKKKIFFECIKLLDLSQRYSTSEDEMYSRNFHIASNSYENNTLEIRAGVYGNFESRFVIDEFPNDINNYIKTKEGFIRYDFNKFHLHSCIITKKNSLIPRELEKNYEFLCKECKNKLVIYGYEIPHGCEGTDIKTVPFCINPWPDKETEIKYKELRELEKRNLFLNLTESAFENIYKQYLRMHNSKYSINTVVRVQSFNEEYFNDDRDMDDQSQEFWNSQ
jgi:hypothetical protein